MSAGGQLASGIGGRKAAKMQNEVAKINAFLAEQDAKAAKALGTERAVQVNRSSAATQADAILERVAMLGTGALFGGGTESGFLDDINAQRAFAVESEMASGNNVARSYLLEARSERLQGSIGVQSANYGLGASVVGGAAEFADVWRRYGSDGY